MTIAEGITSRSRISTRPRGLNAVSSFVAESLRDSAASCGATRPHLVDLRRSLAGFSNDA